jgi:hypothetical protein
VGAGFSALGARFGEARAGWRYRAGTTERPAGCHLASPWTSDCVVPPQKALFACCADEWRNDSWELRFILDAKHPAQLVPRPPHTHLRRPHHLTNHGINHLVAPQRRDREHCLPPPAVVVAEVEVQRSTMRQRRRIEARDALAHDRRSRAPASDTPPKRPHGRTEGDSDLRAPTELERRNRSRTQRLTRRGQAVVRTSQNARRRHEHMSRASRDPYLQRRVQAIAEPSHVAGSSSHVRCAR